MTGFEPLLVGTTAAATGAEVYLGAAAPALLTPSATTAGLFGAGGTFGWGQTLSTLTSAAGLAGTIAGGNAAAAQARYQAAVAAQQAEYQRKLAAVQERQARQQSSAALGRQRALLAARGADLTAGSPLLSQIDTAADAELEARLIRSQGEARANDFYSQAALYRMQGRTARNNAYLSAGTRLLGNTADFVKSHEAAKAPVFFKS